MYANSVGLKANLCNVAQCIRILAQLSLSLLYVPKPKREHVKFRYLRLNLDWYS